jgi:hypothetical protein
MLNILSHKGSTNQNITEISIHPSQNGHHEKNRQQKILVRIQGEKGDLYTIGWWESKLVQLLWKSIQRFLKKLKVELPYDPAVPLLGIYLKECKSTYT